MTRKVGAWMSTAGMALWLAVEYFGVQGRAVLLATSAYVAACVAIWAFRDKIDPAGIEKLRK